MDSAPWTAEFPRVLNYGFGWDVDSYKGLPVYRQSGNTLYYAAHLAFFPDQVLVVAASANTSVYVGEYSQPYYGPCNVWLEDLQEGEEGKEGAGEDKNKTLVSMLWDCRTLISHLHFNELVLKHDHPGFHAMYVASFLTGSNGKVTSINLELGEDTIKLKRHKEVKEEKDEMEEEKEDKKNAAEGVPQAHVD